MTSKSPVGDISVVTLIRTELHYYNITLHHANLHYTTPHYTTTTTTLEIDRQIVSRTEGEIERHREKVTERIRERETQILNHLSIHHTGTTFHVWTIGVPVSHWIRIEHNLDVTVQSDMKIRWRRSGKNDWVKTYG